MSSKVSVFSPAKISSSVGQLRAFVFGRTDGGRAGAQTGFNKKESTTVVDCSIDGTSNVVNGGAALPLVDREQFHWDLGVGVQLRAAIGQVPTHFPGRATLDHAMVRIQHTFYEARHVLLGFRSLTMKSMTLDQALSCLRDELAASNGVRFRVFVTGRAKSLKPAIQERLYLISREALINASRHSEGTTIEAEVEYRPRGLRILILDNGRGIDPKSLQWGRHAHSGLVGMKERAAAIGAELRIRSRLGAGTEVEIWIPSRTMAEVPDSGIGIGNNI